MHAFVRFREMDDDGGERFVAWFEPDHFIAARRPRRSSSRRFTAMRWSILTPDGSRHWDGEA